MAGRRSRRFGSRVNGSICPTHNQWNPTGVECYACRAERQAREAEREAGKTAMEWLVDEPDSTSRP